MSSTDDPGKAVPTGAGSAVPSEDASIELDRAYDDREDPTTLTVFPADAEWPEIGTTWISMDVDHAVTIEDVR